MPLVPGGLIRVSGAYTNWVPGQVLAAFIIGDEGDKPLQPLPVAIEVVDSVTGTDSVLTVQLGFPSRGEQMADERVCRESLRSCEE